VRLRKKQAGCACGRDRRDATGENNRRRRRQRAVQGCYSIALKRRAKRGDKRLRLVLCSRSSCIRRPTTSSVPGQAYIESPATLYFNISRRGQHGSPRSRHHRARRPGLGRASGPGRRRWLEVRDRGRDKDLRSSQGTQHHLLTCHALHLLRRK
jgi:hypothetical protein